MKVSVIVPCFNECATIARILAAVRAAPLDELQIVVVDDGSTDGTAEILASNVSRMADRVIYEVGISYDGRTYEEGKKIGWRDGIRAIYTILKYNFLGSKPMPNAAEHAARPLPVGCETEFSYR